MTAKYIMALDQGTTSSRCIIYDKQGMQISSAQREFRQIFPEAGWVEHDPMEIWSTQLEVALEALRHINAKADDIDSIGITNQRETTVVWDKRTGLPVYNAIVWQCRRTAGFCEDLKAEGLMDSYREKTGLLIDPYFSGTKLNWILEHVPDARAKAESGDLLFGTIETWLIWKLTGGRVHVTDYSNAARTMMFNIRTLKWDEEILQRLNIPVSMLPEVRPSSCIYGETDAEYFGGSIAIGGAAGDQQAALFGQTCFGEGDAKNTFGTGGFVLVNTGSNIVRSGNGLLSTIAWGIGDHVEYALEGSVFVSGAAIKWLRDELGIIQSAADTDGMARLVEDTAGVYVVPAFSVVLLEDMGQAIQNFKVDGGAAANDFLLEFQADILGQDVYRPVCIETTSLGAAYLAGLATGFWKSKDDIVSNWKIDRIFHPKMDEERREKLISGWHEAVARIISGH